MAGVLSVEIVNVADGSTIATSTNPPFFQVQVSWSNPKTVAGTVTLAATNGVTITPAAGFPVGAKSEGVNAFSLSAANSVMGVTLTARIDVPTNPPVSASDVRSNITVNVS